MKPGFASVIIVITLCALLSKVHGQNYKDLAEAFKFNAFSVEVGTQNARPGIFVRSSLSFSTQQGDLNYLIKVFDASRGIILHYVNDEATRAAFTWINPSVKKGSAEVEHFIPLSFFTSS